jgi:hypothetical protein
MASAAANKAATSSAFDVSARIACAVPPAARICLDHRIGLRGIARIAQEHLIAGLPSRGGNGSADAPAAARDEENRCAHRAKLLETGSIFASLGSGRRHACPMWHQVLTLVRPRLVMRTFLC